MGVAEISIIVVGLVLFEIVSSVDNAVVNADIVSTLSARSRRIFLIFGVFFAVFLVRGALPLLIVYFATPGLSLASAFMAALSSEPEVQEIIERQAPILLAAGGMFLVYLFFNWLFLETKNYAFFLERRIHKHYYFWFYAVASLILLFVAFTTVKINPLISLGALIGSTGFFIVSGFRRSVEEKEKGIMKESSSKKEVRRRRPHAVLGSNWFFVVIIAVFLGAVWLAVRSGSGLALGITTGSVVALLIVWSRKFFARKRNKLLISPSPDFSKVLYLILLDATFSIDGVLGAFAFTRAVPLILIGNGIGAMVILWFTVKNSAIIKKYAYLKNGAMYSIGFLGLIMLLESLGRHIPFWASPLITLSVIGLFLYLSKRELEMKHVIQ